MADSDKAVSYAVGADPSNFEQGMQKAASAAAGAAKTIDNEFKKIGNTVEALNKYMLGFVSVLAGGGALKKFISDANEWNSSAGKMAAQLGISTEKASVLNVALKHLGIDSDVYLSASQKLSKQVFSNADAFKVMGVEVRDAAGHYRPVTEVMGEVNQKLAAIKNPIEQNIAGQQAYGKGWSEVRGIIKLTAAQMDESEQRARSLGLIVGPEGVAASKQYSAQMRDLNLVGKSLEVQFGNQLLPVFAHIGGFMAEEGPQAGKIFGLVLEGLAFAAASTYLALKDMGDGIGALAAQGAALLTGDIAGVIAIGKARDEESAKNAASYEKLKARFSQPLPAAKIADGPDINKGNSDYHFKEKEVKVKKDPAEKSRAGEWEAQLSEAKLGYQELNNSAGTFYQFGKQEELKFWQDKLSLTQKGSAENIAVRRKLADLQIGINTDSYQHELASLQSQEAAFKNSTDAKLNLLDQEAALVKQRYGQESKEYEGVQKRIIETKRQAVEQQKQVDLVRAESVRSAALVEVGIAEQQAQLELDTAEITSAEMLSKQQQFEQKRFAIAFQGLAEREQIALLDPDRNIVELAQTHAQIEALEGQHQLRMGQIARQQVLASTQYSRQVYDSMATAMQSSLGKMIQGQMSFSTFMKSMWNNLRNSVANVLAQMLVDHIKNTVIMAALKKALAVFDIGTDAARAGAGAAASAASTPVVGWFTAPVAAAAVFAMAGAFAGSVPSFSAEGGYDIPGSINPIVQTHASEMILPAKHADVIRRMADSEAGQGGGGGGDVHVHMHSVVNDERAVRRLLIDNNSALMEAIRKAKRDFK